MRKFIYYWAPALLFMVIIFSFSMRQRLQVSETYSLNFLFFKTLHVLEYSFLYLLFFRALRNTVRKPGRVNLYFFAFLLTVFYASTDEMHQLFVATREGTVRDVIIDAFGASLIWIFLVKLLPKMPKKLQKSAKILELS